MKKKKYFSLMLLIIMLMTLVAPINVGALSYTGYKRGDEIEIQLAEGVTSKFYVVEDSSTTKATVIAVHKDYVNEETTYNYEEAVSQLETLQSTWTNVTKVSLPTMTDLFVNPSLDKEFNFKDPAWAVVDKDDAFYWTSTEATYEEKQDSYWVVQKKTASDDGNIGTATGKAKTEKGYLRPTVTVRKVNIVGNKDRDYTEEELQKGKEQWKKLVDNTKKNLEDLLKDSEDYTYEFDTAKENVFTVKLTSKVNQKTYTITFHYFEGVVAYTLPEDEPEGYEEAHSLTLKALISEYCKLYNYDFEKFINWLNKDLCLDLNGVYFKNRNDLLIEFYVNVVEGVTGYTETPEEKNPSTGDVNMFVIVGGMLLVVGLGVASYKKIKTN